MSIYIRLHIYSCIVSQKLDGCCFGQFRVKRFDVPEEAGREIRNGRRPTQQRPSTNVNVIYNCGTGLERSSILVMGHQLQST